MHGQRRSENTATSELKERKKKTSQASWSCLNMHQVTENDGYHAHLSDAKRRSADWQAWSSETKPWHPEVNKESKMVSSFGRQTTPVPMWEILIGRFARLKT